MSNRLSDHPGHPTLQFSFLKDPQFHLALLIAPVFLLLMSWLMPAWSEGIQASGYLLLMMAVWQPLIEEILFRAFIQERLNHRHGLRRAFGPVSQANLITSLLFGAAHLMHHSTGWAVAVIMPSLIFGYFKDRHRTVLPCILLHSAYNLCYLAVGTFHNAGHHPG